MNYPLFFPTRRRFVGLFLVLLLSALVHARHEAKAEALEKITPLQLLEKLKGTSGVTIAEQKKGWVTVEDLDQLTPLLDDKSPCGSVTLAISSLLGDGKSTIGNEAAYMIIGHFKGVYPPSLNSQLRPEGGIPEARKLMSEYRKKQPAPQK